jgi:ribonuclease T1
MRFPPRATRIGAAAALLSALLVGGTVSATPAGAAAQPVATTRVVAGTQAVGTICHSDLPSQAYDTLRLIAQGGPYPYTQDGSVFQNREGILPSRPSGYYHE